MAMAATALINPSTSYYAHSPYSSSGSYHSSAPTPPSTLSGLISPVDSRRTSDDNDMSHRQSLPSIQEVIGKGASSYSSSSAPPTSLPTPSLPSPFGPPSSARSFSTEASSDRQPSPHGLHHPIPPPPSSASSIYNPRPDGYPGSMRSQPPPPPPPSSQPQQHPQHPPQQQQQQQQQQPPLPPPLSSRPQPRGPPPSPPPSMESHAGLSSYHHQPPPPPPPSMQSSQQQQHQSSQHHHQQQQQHQSQPPHSHLPHQQHHQQHPPPPPPHHPYHHPPSQDSKPQHAHSPPHLNIYPPSSSASVYGSQSSAQQPLPPPPGQMPPLSASYPVSPRHSGPPSLPSPYEAHQQTPVHEGSPDFGRARTRYDQTVNRHYEAWNYSEYLSKIGSSARTIFNFADAFGSIVREEHGSQPMAGRMPSERELYDMINNADWLKVMLENLRIIIQQTVVNERSGPGSASRQKPYEEMDTTVYGDSMAVKKRRGRAAPPGRCHSCNRIDTPEWRRGPDGARTLCNACGLHYAKLERKKQLESRAIRPNAKHPDERH